MLSLYHVDIDVASRSPESWLAHPAVLAWNQIRPY